MKVIPQGKEWAVVRDGRLLGLFATNEAAWRYADRLAGEPVSPAERKSDWIAGKIFGGSGKVRQVGEAKTTAKLSAVSSRRNRQRVETGKPASKVAKLSGFVPNNEAWRWPDALEPLKAWLAEQHVDVTGLKSARQALFLAQTLGKLAVRMPKRRADHFPALMNAQRLLCGPTPSSRAAGIPTEKTRDHRLGTFGPASGVRKIDPTTYKIGEGART